MLGVLVGLGVTRLDMSVYEAALEENFSDKPKLIPMNKKALELGAAWAVNK